MNIKDILSLDVETISKLNKKELSKLTVQLGSAANKRIKRIEQKNENSPAYESIIKSGGKISAANKNINQLRSEFARAKKFLEAKTSSLTGIKAFRSDIEKRLDVKFEADIFNKMIKTYNRLSELNENFLKKFGSNQIQELLYDKISENPNITDDEVTQFGIELINNFYEESEATITNQFEDLLDEDFYTL